MWMMILIFLLKSVRWFYFSYFIFLVIYSKKRDCFDPFLRHTGYLRKTPSIERRWLIKMTSVRSECSRPTPGETERGWLVVDLAICSIEEVSLQSSLTRSSDDILTSSPSVWPALHLFPPPCVQRLDVFTFSLHDVSGGRNDR